jgi:hypothetical protein
MLKAQADIFAEMCQFLVGRMIVDLDLLEPFREIKSIAAALKQNGQWQVIIAIEAKTIPVMELLGKAPYYMLVDY